MLPPVSRSTVRHLVPVTALVVLLAGCGSPPEPPRSNPPQARGSIGAGPSGMPFPLPSTGFPGGGMPTPGYPTGLPTPGYPTGLPIPGYPIIPTRPATRTRTPTPSPTRSLPPAAPACPSSGPTRAQMLAAVRNSEGLPPGETVEVRLGPFCAGSWQLAALGIVGEDPEDAEELLMVTTGRPTSLRLVAAGTDVCTDEVEDDAPAGIRVRACGF